MPIVKYVKGDITKATPKYIGHCVNCKDVMGSGVAKALFDKWKQVKEQYHKYNWGNEPEDLLGRDAYIDCGNITVINIYGQFDYGYDRKRYVNYAMISKALLNVNDTIRSSESKDNRMLALPKIGCGLAGGDWDIMKEIIDDATPDIEVWIYEL